MSSLKATPVIPLIQAENTKIAVQIAEALKAGGLTTLEVVLRTDAAMKCMEAIVAEVEGVTVGAGTVLTPAQANEAADCGAQFIVSPGLNADVVAASKARGLEIYPGCMTASEVQLAWNLGLRTVKFFPAKLAGGVPMLKAFSSVFREMSFMPTGGVSADNLKSYLEVPAVVACGGSWLTPAADINAGNFDAITTLAREAMDLARQVRPNI
jgi:2-dehydro-3-deoxyphosphogluconate aldolase/(4S)-4-hydroxy-2-oxoglutarate aldolase